MGAGLVLVRGRRKEFCRVAAVAPNLDHIASMKPGRRINVLWCEIGKLASGSYKDKMGPVGWQGKTKEAGEKRTRGER